MRSQAEMLCSPRCLLGPVGLFNENGKIIAGATRNGLTPTVGLIHILEYQIWRSIRPCLHHNQFWICTILHSISSVLIPQCQMNSAQRINIRSATSQPTTKFLVCFYTVQTFTLPPATHNQILKQILFFYCQCICIYSSNLHSTRFSITTYIIN